MLLIGLQADLRIIGLRLAACDKSVQLIDERALWPPEKQHEPWLTRVCGQLRAALTGLEAEIARRPLAATPAQMTQAAVTSAITWYFVRQMLPQIASPEEHPALAAFSVAAESLAQFRAAPHGEGICVPVC